MRAAEDPQRAEPAPTTPAPQGLLAPALPTLMGVAVAVSVCLPFVGGRLLLLDFVSGPHQAVLPPEAFGLTGGALGGLGSTLAFHLLDWAFGPAGTWLAAMLIFPVATTAMA
ncbi:MAG: hypothetical protein ACYDEN_13020, partial [Acidimicrobiales bacterium]